MRDKYIKIHPKFREFITHFYFAIEWRIIATAITFAVAYIVSGNIKISLGIAGIESIAKMFIQTAWLQYRVKSQHVANMGAAADKTC